MSPLTSGCWGKARRPELHHLPVRGQGVGEEAGAGLREVGVRAEPEASGQQRGVKWGAAEGLRELGASGREPGCGKYDS